MVDLPVGRGWTFPDLCHQRRTRPPPAAPDEYLLDQTRIICRASRLRHERAAADLPQYPPPKRTEPVPAVECDADHMPCFGAALLLAHIIILAKNRKEFS
jgi:hypothetical protein